MEEFGNAFQFVVAVVDAFEQRPLVLDRVVRCPRVALAEFHQLGGIDARCARQQLRAQVRLGRMQRQRECRLHPFPRQPVEDPRVADRREDQVLVPDPALRAQQRDCFEHVVEVVGRLAHAHELDFLHRAQRSAEHHLRQDFGATQMTFEPFPARHAEDAPHRATDLGRDAHRVARQQHAFHRLPIGQVDQQPRRTVPAGMRGAQARDRRQFGCQPGKCVAQGKGKKILRLLSAAIQRQCLCPSLQNGLLVGGFRARGSQAFAEVFDLHGRRCYAAVEQVGLSSFTGLIPGGDLRRDRTRHA